MKTNSIKIAKIIGAHGIRGEIKLQCFLENAADLKLYQPLQGAKGEPLELSITGQTNHHLIAKVKGVTDRNAAEILRGTELFGSSQKRKKLPKNQFYVTDLIGLNAVTESGEIVGKVTAAYNFGAGDIIEIQGEKGEILLPFKAPFVGEITNGKITVTLPEYLEAKDE